MRLRLRTSKMPKISALILLSLLCSPARPQQKKVHPQSKHPAEELTSDVSWSHEWDRFKGQNHVGLVLSHISKTKPQLFFSVQTFWNSNGNSDRLSDDNRWDQHTYIAFGDAQKPGVAVMPQKNVIVLLNKTQRIYLKGSPTCESLSCDLFDISTNAALTPFILSDIVNAESVEGVEDDVEFAFTSKQLEAIREFCTTRHLTHHFKQADQLQGKTASAAARLLADDMTSRDPQTHDKVLLLELSQSRLEVERDGFKGVRETQTINWKDVTLEKLSFLGCGPLSTERAESDCVERHIDTPANTFVYQEHRKLVDDKVDSSQLSQWVYGDNGSVFLYVYYRMMFCGDPPNFTQNS